MIGSKVFDKIFDSVPKSNGRGRNESLIAQRNECILDRYYYYGTFSDKRFMKVLEKLSEEFFISVYTIRDILKSRSSYLQEIKKTKPSHNYLQLKWKHLKW